MAFNERVSATGQLIARGSDDYNIEAEWAYVSYALNGSWAIRSGRFRLPLLAYSSYLDVGYAYSWIRPPVETNRASFTALEGYDLLYHGSIGAWDMSLQFYGGRLTDVQEGKSISGEVLEYDSDLTDLFGMYHTFSYDWLTLNLYAAVANATIDFESDELTQLFTIMRSIGREDVANTYSLALGEKTIYYGGAVKVEHMDWLVNAELSFIDKDDVYSFGSESRAWHLMLGRQIDDVMFHLTYAESESDPDYSLVETLPEVVQIPHPNPAVGGTVPVPLRWKMIDAIHDDKYTSVTAGIRYDFAPATVFKFEVTALKQENASGGRGEEFHEEGTLVNFAIDYVF